MARTTISIDTPVYNKIKSISRQQHKTVTRVISDLLNKALHGNYATEKELPFSWYSKKMNAKIDYRDKEELFRALDS